MLQVQVALHASTASSCLLLHEDICVGFTWKKVRGKHGKAKQSCPPELPCTLQGPPIVEPEPSWVIAQQLGQLDGLKVLGHVQQPAQRKLSVRDIWSECSYVLDGVQQPAQRQLPVGYIWSGCSSVFVHAQQPAQWQLPVDDIGS